MANTVLAGYEMPIGAKKEIIFDHAGPAAYSNFFGSAGTGDVVNASDLGMGGFDFIDITDFTPNGNFTVIVIPINQGTGNATQSFRLVWFNAANGSQGAEVTNGNSLAAQTIRVRARGV